MVAPCNAEQQRQTPRQSRIRVRSDLTHLVSVVNSTKPSIHAPFQRQMSGQLRFLGLTRHSGAAFLKLVAFTVPAMFAVVEQGL